MKERYSPLYKRAKRLERILDVLSEEPTVSNDELQKRARLIDTSELGNIAERRAIRILSQITEAGKVIKASQEEDSKQIDVWVLLNVGHKFDKIPVQVKSSKRKTSTVQAELSRRKKKHDKAPIIVLNCGRNVGDENIISNFIRKVELQTGIVLTQKP